MNKDSIILLLTATIDPKDQIFLKRKNPIVRENDYLITLQKWLKKGSFPIVFCENSGYSLNKINNLLETHHNLKTEVLQLNRKRYPNNLGKGYGELLIMKHAIFNSKIIKDSDYVIKITGRYFINNIEKIIEPLTKKQNIFVLADLKKNLTWADSRIFACKPPFILNYLAQFQDLLNDYEGFYLEHALARATLRAIADGYKWVPFPTKPIIIGYYGTSDIPCKTSKIRWLIGEIIHRLKNYLNKR